MKAALTASLVASPIAFIAGNLYVANLLSLEGSAIMNLTSAVLTLPGYMVNGGGPSAEPMAICVGLLLVCAVWLAYARYLMNAGEHRAGEEHGSSRWATHKEAKAFGDSKSPDNNIILTNRYGLALKKDKFDLKTDRNKNVLVVGGSGSGKTRYYVKPNVMQMNANYFVTDSKGTAVGDLGHMLVANGYDVITFNTIEFWKSHKMNPYVNLKSEADILKFVDILIKNTTGEKSQANDPFWENAERLLYTALIAYQLNHCPESDQNIPGLLTLLSLAETREGDESYKSPLDVLFDELETGMRFARTSNVGEFNIESRSFDNGQADFRWIKIAEPVTPDSDFALSNYKAFKTAAGKTLKSIIISCNVRMKPCSIKEVRELLEYDEMRLSELGDPNKKIAIFAIMSDTNSTFDFLFAILMQQALDVLCETALTKYGGELPTPVHFVLDEFANIGTLPDFERTIAVVRSRNISCSIILQSLAQLKAVYGDNAQTIADCCDTTLFLGGKSTETNKEISEAIGKQTLSMVTVNDSRGSNSSTTRNYNRSERDLMQASEVGRLPRDEAILLITGAFPIKDKKYKIEHHPRYAQVDPGHEGAEYPEKFDVTKHGKGVLR